jgi:hypothetical protein
MEKADLFRTFVIMDAPPYRDHPSEEALERFLLHQSRDDELEIVETHILACELCVTQLETLELQIAATKIALRDLVTASTGKRSSPRSNWTGWFTVPRLSWATAAAVVAFGAIAFSIPRDVTVATYRGSETPIVSEWHPLRLHLNAADLPEGPVTVELVDRTGSTVWKGLSVIQHDEVSVTIPRIKQAGPHFLRLYAPVENDAQSELLREFALQVKWKF